MAFNLEAQAEIDRLAGIIDRVSQREQAALSKIDQLEEELEQSQHEISPKAQTEIDRLSTIIDGLSQELQKCEKAKKKH